MHHIYEFLHWERGSESSYAQRSLLDCVFSLIIRSPLKELDSVSQRV
jgi:hypothetical protein